MRLLAIETAIRMGQPPDLRLPEVSELPPEQLYRMDRAQQEFLKDRARACSELQPRTRRTCIHEETSERIRSIRRTQTAQG